MCNTDLSVEMLPQYDSEHGQMVIYGKVAGQIFEVARVDVTDEDDMKAKWQKLSDHMKSIEAGDTDAV